MKKRALLLLLLLLCLTTSFAMAEEPQQGITAKSYVVMHAVTGQQIQEYNADLRVNPAGLTKLMTALVAADTFEADEVLTVPEEVPGMVPFGEPSMRLKAGEEIPYRSVVYGLLLGSANDAAHMIASLCGGNEAFVQKMNRRATDLGCTDTHFVNTTGITHEAQYTTAADMALILQAADKDPLIREVLHTAKITLPGTNATQSRVLHSANHLISHYIYPYYVYTYATGGRTAETNDATSAAVTASKNNKDLVCVVFESPKSEEKPFAALQEARQLLVDTYDRFTEKTALKQGEIAAEARIWGGSQNRVLLYAEKSVTGFVELADDEVKFEKKISLPERKKAPIKQGEMIGTITYFYKENAIGSTNLLASAAVGYRPLVDLAEYVGAILRSPVAKAIYVILGALIIAVLVYLYRIAHKAKKQKRRRNRER